MSDLIVMTPEEINGGASKTNFPSRKGFLYRAPYINAGDLNNIIQPNSHLRITLNQDVLTDWKNQEIKIWTSTTSGEFLSNSTSNGRKTKKQERNVILHFFTPDFRGDNESSTTYFITLDKPIDFNEVNEGNQTLYRIQDIDSSIEIPDELHGLLSANSSTEGVLIDTKRWEDEEDNFEVSVALDDLSNATKKLSIAMSKYADIYYIIVRGKDSVGIERSIPLKVKNPHLTPMLMNIIETNNKLVKYLPWFDYDVIMPFVSAKSFIQAKSLKSLTSDEKLLEAMLDIYILSYTFRDQFSFVEYVIDGKDAGKIKGDQYIGYQAKQAAALTGKNLSEVIDSRYDRYLIDTKLDETSENVRILKQFIASMSRFTAGQLAIGKGNNSFNQVYMPWYLKPFGEIKPKKVAVPSPIPGSTATVSSWVFDKDATKFQLQSKYFILANTNNGEIRLPNELSLSQNKVIQTDRKLVLPFPKDIHTAQDKIPSAGDINTKSSDDISFIGYSFIDKTKLQQFFGTTKNFSIDIQTTQQITSSTPSQRIFDEPANAADAFKKLGYQGSFVSGSLEPDKVEQRFAIQVRVIYNHIPMGAPGTYDYYITIAGQSTHRHWEPGFSYPSSVPINIVLQEVLGYLKIPADVVSDVVISGIDLSDKSNSDRSLDYTQNGFITFKRKAWRIASGFVYNVNAGDSLKTSIFDRQATFDKDSKINETELFLPNAINGNILENLDIELTKEISITEIIIGRDWGEKTAISIGSIPYETKDFNTKDESIAVDRYLFR